MYAKQLGEGTFDNLESCIDTPTLGNGEKFNHPICGKEKMAVITNSSILPEEALWYGIHC